MRCATPLSLNILFVCTIFVAASATTPLRASVTVEDIVQIREFSGLDVCPAKNTIAVRVDSPDISENRIRHSWLILDWPSGKIRSRADAGESLITVSRIENVPPQWSADCRWIYYRARFDGEVQIWRLNTRSGQTEKVTSDGADILSFNLSENGRELIYKVGAERAAISAAEALEYEHGVLYNEDIHTAHPPLMRTFQIAGRWSAVRRWFTEGRGHLLSRQPPEYKVAQIGDGEIRIASESPIGAFLKKEPDYTHWVKFANTGVTISPAGDHAVAQMVTKSRFALGGGIAPVRKRLVSVMHDRPSEILECNDPPCEGEYFAFLKWSEDESTIYFIGEQTRGAAGVYAWTPETNAVRTIVETEGTLGALASVERYESMPCPIMGDFAFCTAAEHSAPPRLLAIELKSGKIETVLDPNAAFREKFKLKTERIRWLDKFKRKALGVLVYPREFRNGKRYPLVITGYKCRGLLNGGLADGGPEYALAESGFFVLCIDVNSNYPPLEVTTKYSPGPQRFVGMLAEYESAIDMLTERGYIDRRRVGITGMSMSSNAVSYALTHLDYFAAAATRSLGVASPEKEILMAHPTSGWNANFRISYNIAEDGRNEEAVFDDLAVTRRADLLNASILVQSSESEYLIALPAVHALLKRNKAVEMHIFPDETHFLHQPVHRFVNFTRNLDWFRFWLQNYEDPDPEKADQYARWRNMRSERCAWDEPEDEKPSYCEHSNAVH